MTDLVTASVMDLVTASVTDLGTTDSVTACSIALQVSVSRHLGLDRVAPLIEIIKKQIKGLAMKLGCVCDAKELSIHGQPFNP